MNFHYPFLFGLIIFDWKIDSTFVLFLKFQFFFLRLHELTSQRQIDRQNHERRLTEERRQRQSLEAQLNNERKYRKAAEEKAAR